MGLVLSQLKVDEIQGDLFSEGLIYSVNNKPVLQLGSVSKTLLRKFEIENPVFFADFNWQTVLSIHTRQKVLFEEMSKFPAVRRDLALVIDRQIKFRQIEESA